MIFSHIQSVGIPDGRYIPPRHLVCCFPFPAQVGLPPCGSQNEYCVGTKMPGLGQALFAQWLSASASWVSPRTAKEHRVVGLWSWVYHSSNTHQSREGMNHPALFSVIVQSLQEDTVALYFRCLPFPAAGSWSGCTSAGPHRSTMASFL